jgi:hypothetical protein
MPKPVAKIAVKEESAHRQTSVIVDRLNELTSSPILQGRLLEGVSIKEGTNPTRIRHGLGRVLRGWIVVGNNITSTGLIYDKQDTNNHKDQELWLVLNTGSTTVTFKINLWVF